MIPTQHYVIQHIYHSRKTCRFVDDIVLKLVSWVHPSLLNDNNNNNNNMYLKCHISNINKQFQFVKLNTIVLRFNKKKHKFSLKTTSKCYPIRNTYSSSLYSNAGHIHQKHSSQKNIH